MSLPDAIAGSNEDPWELVWGQPYIDANRLSAAIEAELARNNKPDFRTRVLIRDAARALEAYWGEMRFSQWLKSGAAKIEKILQEDLGEEGFHNIKERLVSNMKKAQIEQIFDLLGSRIQHQVDVYIAGSIATLIAGLTDRPTDDIDFVDEVPAEIRQQKEAGQLIKQKNGFMLGHVLSHYLPANWQSRCQYLGDFGKLRVYLVDPGDIFVGKLSSKLEKHKDDLRVLAEKLDKDEVRKRLLTDGKAFLDSPFDRPAIEDNWRFIYRQELFSDKR